MASVMVDFCMNAASQEAATVKFDTNACTAFETKTVKHKASTYAFLKL